MNDARVDLRYDRTVTPASIHRRHSGTVFLADVQPDGTGSFHASGRLPEGHEYYAAHTAEANRRLDPMLVLEVCRQAHLYLAHAFFDVPLGMHFILKWCELRIAPDAFRRLPETGVGELTMTALEVSPQRSGARVRGLAPRFALTLGAEHIGEVALSMSFGTPAAYQTLRMRGRTEAPPSSEDVAAPDLSGLVVPEAVGRIDHADVLLADLRRDDRGDLSARLIVPVGHLGLFDHPLDHVPGSLLIEAARQLVTARSGDPREAVMTSMNAKFHAFTELNAPVRLVARADEAVVTVIQNDVEVASVAVDTTVPALSLRG